MIDLVLGGNKSGKSDFALELLSRTPQPWTFVATGKSKDLTFREQIMAHRQSRNQDIAVVEITTDLISALGDLAAKGGGILVDSLDFWLFSLYQCFPNMQDRSKITTACLDNLACWSAAPLILVSTEMSLGPLAFDAEVRAFSRELGQLNREIARLGTRVYLVIAGLAQQLK